MYNLATPIFNKVDKEVQKILKKDVQIQFDELSSLYWDTWKKLKLHMGTSAGWPWLGEYIVFYSIKDHLQEMLDCEFVISKKRIHGRTIDIRTFVDHEEHPEYILGHNGKLTLQDTKAVRPDIYLYKTMGKKLILTIDVKVVITSSTTLHIALSKLNRTINDSKWKSDISNKPLGYLMCLDPRFPCDLAKVRKYQQGGVGIVGPHGSSIESKLSTGDYPMTSFAECISQIHAQL